MEKDKSHYTINKVQGFDGFSGSYAIAGEPVRMLVKAYFDSDQEDFHIYMDQICKTYLSKFIVQHIYCFFILVHIDKSADIYINNVPYLIEIKIRRAIKAGEAIFDKDILDITGLNFLEIPIKENDQIIFCFKHLWKFGLYFDLTRSIKLDNIKIELGEYYKLLAYKDIYSILSQSDTAIDLFNDGWFPFLALIPNEYKKLSAIYKNNIGERKELFLKNFIDTYDAAKIMIITDRWWSKKIISDKRKIIDSGISAYLENTESGNINSIKNLYSEIEGVLRLLFYDRFKKNPSFKNLKDFILEMAQKSFSSKSSLGFPAGFYDYLNKTFFYNFNLATEKVDVSRHSVAHGVADQNYYTRVKALQTILTLDQIIYYIL